MLVVEDDCVYEIDETCVERRHPAVECGIYEKLSRRKERDTKDTGAAEGTVKKGRA